jgi:hypothetical protein
MNVREAKQKFKWGLSELEYLAKQKGKKFISCDYYGISTTTNPEEEPHNVVTGQPWWCCNEYHKDREKMINRWRNSNLQTGDIFKIYGVGGFMVIKNQIIAEDQDGYSSCQFFAIEL